MLEFCPLCQKNGYKRNITLCQINLEEAVWLCEYSECPWPFGYEDFTFVSREVGKTWSAEWELPKPTALKSSEPFSVSSNELGLDTPPVTPGSGSETMHKESVFGNVFGTVASSSLNTPGVIQAKASSVSLKNGSKKLRQSLASECESIHTKSTGTRISTQIDVPAQTGNSNDRDFKSKELMNDVSLSLGDEETRQEFKGGFSLGDDGNLENLDNCLSVSQGFIDACDMSEAVTESIFNVGKPLKDNLSMHESTVKNKKRLSDNTKGTVVRDHCYSSAVSKKVADEFRSSLSEGLGHRVQRSSVDELHDVKRRPRIKSIEETNVKLAEAITVSNQSIRDTSKASSVTLEKTHPAVVCDITEIAKKEPEQNVINTEASPCITVSKNNSESRKIENRTLAIDGLLPINISYELPSFVEECITVPWSTDYKKKAKEEIVSFDPKQEPVVDNSVISIDMKLEAPDCAEIKSSQSTISSKTELRRQSMKKPLKRSITKLAKYQGFNFGTLKKKSKTNCEENIKSSLPNILSPDNVSSCPDLTWTSEISCTTTATVDSKSESVSSGIYGHLKSTVSVENCSSVPSSSNLKSTNAFNPGNDGLSESNFNLDQVLDDLMLSDNEDLTKGFEDDWLVSLFN